MRFYMQIYEPPPFNHLSITETDNITLLKTCIFLRSSTKYYAVSVKQPGLRTESVTDYSSFLCFSLNYLLICSNADYCLKSGYTEL